MSTFFEHCEELDFDDANWKSYFFAECSKLAYLNSFPAKKEFKKIGFTTYKFFDVEGAQCHIAQNKDVVIIAFRGPDKLWADVSVSLQRIGKRKLYICGHSLGAAMATICASRLEEHHPELYTYGSPRVGGKEFVRNCLVNHNRHVNNNDMVTSVPFWIMGFRHHGDLTYINFYGNIRQLTKWQRVKDQLRGRWAAIKKYQFFDGIRDHNMGSYSKYLKRRVGE
jgi:triacylglycerol lipase